MNSDPDRRLGSRFWRFWAAAVLANLGDGIRIAAFPLLAVSFTDDPFLVAVVSAATALPWLLTGLVAGSLADRRGARVLLIAADTTRVGALTLLVAVLLTGTGSLWFLVTVAFVLGVAETMRDVAAQTVVPRLVHTALLERANGRLVAGEVTANEFVGPLLGAALFATGAALPFAVNGATLSIALLLLLSLPASLLRPPVETPGVSRPRHGVRAGLAWLASHRPLRSLVVAVSLVVLADAAWFAVFVLFVNQHLGAGALGFGVYLAIGAGGGLLGAVTTDRLIGGHRHRAVLAGSIAVTAITPGLLVLVPSSWAAIVVVSLTSGGFGVLNVAAVSVRQRLAPEALLGRVTAAWRTFVYGAGALGAIAGGVIAARLDLNATFLFSTVLGVVAVALWWASSARNGTLRPGPA